jgi:hypothetical protein
VVLERAIASACVAAGRVDWANQIPVASGLIPGAADGRRALDLAHMRSDGSVEFIELKIASDTPLYATIELLGYASLWLLARNDPPAHSPALLSAEKIALRVLAPAAYYKPFKLRELEAAVDASVQGLARVQGVQMDFAMDVLNGAVDHRSPLTGAALMASIEQRTALHG